MCIHFRTFFTTFAGDTTHDIERLSISMRRHRSRRQRRQRKNVIGFSVPRPNDTEDDSDTDTDAEVDQAEGRDVFEPSFSAAPSYAEEDLSTRLETLSGELDGLVRYVRRGAENLARGMSDVASAFGVLAFMLEDWDS
jgi:gamma-tubulin complex component 5